MFSCNCPNCTSENVRFDYEYKTVSNGFQENTFMPRLWVFLFRNKKYLLGRYQNVCEYHLERHKRSN